MKKVTKKVLAERLAERLGISKSKAVETLNAVVEIIQESLVKEGAVELRGVGTLKVEEKPATEKKIFGKVTKIPARKVVKLVTSKSLKEKLNG